MQKNTRTIILDDRGAHLKEGTPLVLGVVGEYGTRSLTFELEGQWAEMDSLTVTFTNMSNDPVSVVCSPASPSVDVPWEACQTYDIESPAVPWIALDALGKASSYLTVTGDTDDAHRPTAAVPYRVIKTGNTEGANAQEPTPSVYQQYVAEAGALARSEAQRALDSKADKDKVDILWAINKGILYDMEEAQIEAPYTAPAGCYGIAVKSFDGNSAPAGGVLAHAVVDSIACGDSSVDIPAEVKALEGYGRSAGGRACNTVDLEDGQFIRRCKSTVINGTPNSVYTAVGAASSGHNSTSAVCTVTFSGASSGRTGRRILVSRDYDFTTDNILPASYTGTNKVRFHTTTAYDYIALFRVPWSALGIAYTTNTTAIANAWKNRLAAYPLECCFELATYENESIDTEPALLAAEPGAELEMINDAELPVSADAELVIKLTEV